MFERAVRADLGLSFPCQIDFSKLFDVFALMIDSCVWFVSPPNDVNESRSRPYVTGFPRALSVTSGVVDWKSWINRERNFLVSELALLDPRTWWLTASLTSKTGVGEHRKPRRP